MNGYRRVVLRREIMSDIAEKNIKDLNKTACTENQVNRRIQ